MTRKAKRADGEPSPLTEKQLAFVNEYIIDWNATQAAIRAGYSERGASTQASLLLSNTKVQGELKAAVEARKERTQINADWVLQQAAAAFSFDLSLLYDENGDFLPISQWPKEVMPLVGGLEIDTQYIGSGDDRVEIGRVKKLKLTERLKLLETIGKHISVQAFNDKKSMTHDVSEGLAELLGMSTASGVESLTE